MADETEPTTSADAPADDTTDVAAAVVTDGAYALVVADFSDIDAAWEAYDELDRAVDAASLKIEGVLVLKKGGDGTVEVQKLTDHSVRRGLTWGVVGGVVLGVLFPPSIIGSAAVLGAAGAGVGGFRSAITARSSPRSSPTPSTRATPDSCCWCPTPPPSSCSRRSPRPTTSSKRPSTRLPPRRSRPRPTRPRQRRTTRPRADEQAPTRRSRRSRSSSAGGVDEVETIVALDQAAVP